MELPPWWPGLLGGPGNERGVIGENVPGNLLLRALGKADTPTRQPHQPSRVKLKSCVYLTIYMKVGVSEG